MTAVIILLIIVAGITFILAGKVSKVRKMNKTLLECPYTYKSSGPRTEKIYAVDIKGAYYRGINVDHYCDAYLVLEPCPEDESAVAVYSANGIHIGYLPKEDEFKTKIMETLVEKGRINGYAVIEMSATHDYYNDKQAYFKTRLPKVLMEKSTK